MKFYKLHNIPRITILFTHIYRIKCIVIGNNKGFKISLFDWIDYKIFNRTDRTQVNKNVVKYSHSGDFSTVNTWSWNYARMFELCVEVARLTWMQIENLVFIKKYEFTLKECFLLQIRNKICIHTCAVFQYSQPKRHTSCNISELCQAHASPTCVIMSFLYLPQKHIPQSASLSAPTIPYHCNDDAHDDDGVDDDMKKKSREK